MAEEERYLKHYGILRRSGRYPWGSGKNAYQRSSSFLSVVSELKSQGLTETEIAEALGFKTTDLRAAKSIAKAQKRAGDASLAMRLHEKGLSNVAIGNRMGINESSVRSLLDPSLKERASLTENTAAMLKRQISEKGPIDIGAGVESGVGVSRTRLKTAAAILKAEGYEV